jgi:glycosylphosphatidylinositol deacylase
LDVFTIEVNEEFSALNGGLLMRQARYANTCIQHILSLYPANAKPPKVILVGHSMGGLVARAVYLQPNYIPNSVDTILTINSPHKYDFALERKDGAQEEGRSEGGLL